MVRLWICKSNKVTVQITKQLPRQTYSEHCQPFKMERFANRIMPKCICATRNFLGQGGGAERFVELGHFDKDLIKNTRKTRKYFGLFSPRYS